MGRRCVALFDPGFAPLNLRQVKYTGDIRRFCCRRSGFPRRKSSYLYSLMSSLELVTYPLFPTPPFHFLFFQLADRWTNELADKDSAGMINVADGLMRVTLDACVPSFLVLHGILSRAYVPSQYRIWHVVDALKSIRTCSLELITYSCF